MRYRDGLPSVLKDVSINIKPREKIGVVGRTGSGIICIFFEAFLSKIRMLSRKKFLVKAFINII